jgi:hypothetical protein
MHAATQRFRGTIAGFPGAKPEPGPALLRPIALSAGFPEPLPASTSTPARMSPAPKPRQFTIQGITRAGRTFRPSDWSERLAGALSSFRPKGSGIGAHIGYSPFCVPRVIDGIKCVIVSEALRDIEPMAWDFVMHFARDNELQVVDAGPVPDKPRHKPGG